MALGITISTGSGSSEDFMPIVKYDARAGRMFRVDRVQGANGYENVPTDISLTFKAVFDFENLEVGFMEFGAGSAPVFALTRLGSPMPNRPTPTAKQGVRVVMLLAKECGGDLRELAGNSAAFLRGVDAAHDAYEQGKGDNPGKLPVVVLKSTIVIKSGSGEKTSSNYQPVFEIVGWVPRPDKLVFRPKGAAPAAVSAASTSPVARAAPPSTGSRRVSAPAVTVLDFHPYGGGQEFADADADFG